MMNSEVEINGTQNSIIPGKNSSEEKNNWKQLSLLFLGTSFFGNGTLGITKSIMSIYLKSLGFDALAIGAVSSARGFKAIIDMIAGYLGDKFGRKTIAYIGQFFLVLSHLVYATVSSLGGFIVGGILHGAGSGFNAGAATFGAADLMKKSKALGQGLLEFANFASHTIFAAISMYIYVKVGKQAPFYILGIMPIFGALIVCKYLKEPKDISSSDLNTSKKKAVSLKDSGKFFLKMLSNPKMLAVYYSGFLTKFVDDGLIKVLIPLYALANGHNPAVVAGIATIVNIAFSLATAPSGLISDKIGRKVCMIIGTVILGVSTLAMPLMHDAWMITAMGILIGIGNALIYPSAPAATADIVPDELRATGMGVYKFTHDLGIFIGPLAIGFIMKYFGNQYASFGAAAVMFIGTLLLVLFFKDSNNFEKHSSVH